MKMRGRNWSFGYEIIAASQLVHNAYTIKMYSFETKYSPVKASKDFSIKNSISSNVAC
jgi:hypothetical protein